MHLTQITIFWLIAALITGGIVTLAKREMPSGAAVITTESSDTLNLFRTNVNTSLTNLQQAVGPATTSNPFMVSWFISTSTIATSTFANGLSIASGCVLVNGTCLTSTSGANPTGTVGLTAVNGTASTFLRSDGAPALSQSIVPTWTGLHTFNTGGFINNASSTFTGTTTFAASSLNTALIINGLSYIFPSSRGSNGSILTENGSGTLSWGNASGVNGRTTLCINSTAIGTNSAASTTLPFTCVIPAGTLDGGTDSVHIKASGRLILNTGSEGVNLEVQLGDCTSTSTIAQAANATGIGNTFPAIDIMIHATSTSVQRSTASVIKLNNGASSGTNQSATVHGGQTETTYNGSNQMCIGFVGKASNVINSAYFNDILVEKVNYTP